MNPRRVFYISDGTGITIETVGQTLLTQFPNCKFEYIVFPFINSIEKTREIIDKYHNPCAKDNDAPIVFSSLITTEIKSHLHKNNVPLIDLFNTFIPSLEHRLNMNAAPMAGRMHGAQNITRYERRIDALGFTLSHDDGLKLDDYDQAEVIVTGVSRTGKTPTCLYLAMHYSIKAANYPLVDTDLEKFDFSESLNTNKKNYLD